MRSELSRREFIKLGGAAAFGMAFRNFPPGGFPACRNSQYFTLGRTVYSLRYYQEPSYASQELGYYVTDSVVNVYEQALGDAKATKNPIWLRTDDGWINSAYVQPVRRILNTPVLDIPEKGMLFEVTVPITQSWQSEEMDWQRGYRFYYACTFWVHFTYTSKSGQVWYQVLDDKNKGFFFVQAEHMRPVTAQELTPISPGVPDKRIEVDLNQQRLIAYEGARPVFSSRTATGSFEGDTPIGEFRIERKQPSRHMESELSEDEYDLPGVPWVCYISWNGVSLHGTYWHNNYGTPQSHGCINLSPEAAKWIYRWTDPYVPVEENYLETDYGTRVIVF